MGSPLMVAVIVMSILALVFFVVNSAYRSTAIQAYKAKTWGLPTRPERESDLPPTPCICKACEVRAETRESGE